MNIEKRKLLAIVFALFNLFITAKDYGFGNGFMIWLMYHIYLPLPLIFFSKELGSLTGIGYMRANRPIDKESPPWLIEIMGWFFMFLYLFIYSKIYGLKSL